MNGWFSWRRLGGAMLIVAIAVGGGWLVGSPAFDRLLAWRWRCQIDEADDQTAIAEVKRIGSLGEGGLTDLAMLLGSDRLCVVEAVRQALADQMRSWPSLEPGDRRRRQLRLAQALAKHMTSFSPDVRCVASDIALRILSAAGGAGGRFGPRLCLRPGFTIRGRFAATAPIGTPARRGPSGQRAKGIGPLQRESGSPTSRSSRRKPAAAGNQHATLGRGPRGAA